MKRRGFLALAGAGLLPGCNQSLEQGLFNACDGPALKGEGKDLFDEAVKGLRLDQVWDMHAHLFGHKQGTDDLYLNKKLDHPFWPEDWARRIFFLNAGCIDIGERERINEVMVENLVALVKALEGKDGKTPKVMVMAFDYARTEDGKEDKKNTTFRVSDNYAMETANANSAQLEWTASIHPYDRNAIDRLKEAHAGRARAVKWLPPSQLIDPSSNDCIPFYKELIRLDMPLITHTGDEHAVVGKVIQKFGNPLRLELPLTMGVRVVAAHCATLGEGADSDGSTKSNFKLFSDLMNKPEHEGRLFGDISAVTQANRAQYLPCLLRRKEWHHRLLNGSDYPLPGVMPIFSLHGLVSRGVLDKGRVSALRELRKVNALAFDLTLKRNLSFEGKRFPDSVFQTRSFFERTKPT